MADNKVQRKVFRMQSAVIAGILAFLPVLLFVSCLQLTGTQSLQRSDLPRVNTKAVFEVYAGNYISRTQYPYEMLLVRADGLVYYETGSHASVAPKIRMRQGQITADQLAKLISLVANSPEETASRYGSNRTFFSGPYAFIFSPSRETWQYELRDKRIAANFDPFTQNITGFSDLPQEAMALWTELQSVVNATVPTDIHPDLWPDKYLDPRNYVPPPVPQRKA